MPFFYQLSSVLVCKQRDLLSSRTSGTLQIEVVLFMKMLEDEIGRMLRLLKLKEEYTHV